MLSKIFTIFPLGNLLKSYEKQTFRSLESATTSQINELEKSLKIVESRLEIEIQNYQNQILNEELVNWVKQWSIMEFESDPGFSPMNYIGTA